MAKFCTNCGKEIADGVAFCTECGTPAPADTPQQAPKPQETATEQTIQAPNPQTSAQPAPEAPSEQAAPTQTAFTPPPAARTGKTAADLHAVCIPVSRPGAGKQGGRHGRVLRTDLPVCHPGYRLAGLPDYGVCIEEQKYQALRPRYADLDCDRTCIRRYRLLRVPLAGRRADGLHKSGDGRCDWRMGRYSRTVQTV